jgi:hypothetical protein
LYSLDDGPLKVETCCDVVTIATPIKLIVAIAGIFVEECLTYTSRNGMHPIGIKFKENLVTLSRGQEGKSILNCCTPYRDPGD